MDPASCCFLPRSGTGEVGSFLRRTPCVGKNPSTLRPLGLLRTFHVSKGSPGSPEPEPGDRVLLLVFWELLASRSAPAFPRCVVGVEQVCFGAPHGV